jgi:hypothetical protein
MGYQQKKSWVDGEQDKSPLDIKPRTKATRIDGIYINSFSPNTLSVSLLIMP